MGASDFACPICGAKLIEHHEEKLKLQGWIKCPSCDFRRQTLKALDKQTHPMFTQDQDRKKEFERVPRKPQKKSKY